MEEAERNVGLAAEMDTTVVEISRLKAETHKLRAAAEVGRRAVELKAELAKQKGELETVLKHKNDLEASVQAKTEVAYLDGVVAATKDYEA